MITKENLETSGLDGWVTEFYEIYKNKDRKRSVSDMWLHLVENASKVAEALRRNDLGMASSELAHVFAWLCSFVAKCQDKDLEANNIDKIYLLDEPFSDTVYKLFQNLWCKVCRASPCRCALDRVRYETKIRSKIQIGKRLASSIPPDERHKIPPTLDKWIEMFEDIYENSDYGYPIDYICFHFLEEVGEVCRAILALSRFAEKTEDELTGPELNELEGLKNNYKEELVDVFAWVASLVMKLQFLYKVITGEEGKFRLSGIVWKEYKSPKGNFLYCPKPYCENRPCICPDC